MFSVNAGELTVSGTKKATYHITMDLSDNTIGVTNELNFKASGEMDNGFGWAYNMALDPTSTAVICIVNDRYQLQVLQMMIHQ